MSNIYYTEHNYPLFFKNGFPPVVAWMVHPYSKINLIYDCNGVWDVLINSGMTDRDASLYFDVEDPRGCIELKEEY